MKSIPFWNPLPEYRQIAPEVSAAIRRVLVSGTYVLGPEVTSFETQFARFAGSRYGIGVGNGTDAIALSLKALGVGQGDEVITAANTAIPTVSAIIAAGATPKLVDVLPDTLLMDPTKLARAITKRTQAIIPVHLYGQLCRMDEILRIARTKKLFVIEDFAQATGAGPVRGDLGCFSFYPTKIIGAYGDGGMITTNSSTLAKRAKMLRMYGTIGSYNAKIEGGVNSRLDELQAAILSVKLRYIGKWIRERRRLADRYDTALQPRKTTSCTASVYHLYVVRHKNRGAVRARLKKQGIETKIHYPVPIHLMRAFARLGYKKGDFPVAEEAARTVFSLPIYPGLTDEEQDRIITAIRSLLK
jgi:aminotransferase EvaB